MQAFADGVHRLIAPFAAASAGLSTTDIAYALRSFEELRDLNTLYELYWDYYRGLQRDPNGELTDRSPRDFPAAHNFAGRSIDILVERLKVQGFDSVGAAAVGTQVPTTTEESAISQALGRWWALNRMDEGQGTIHARALAQGDVYVNVGWDSAQGIPIFRVHDATEVTPVYEDHVYKAAYKLWTQTYPVGSELRVRYRLTKYEPARIQKWYQEGLGGQWLRWTQDVDSNGVPDGGDIAWLDAKGDPLGIPIIHFRNKARGEDFGYSDMAALIAPQDSINKRIAALDEAAGYQGAAQWWAMDVDTTALKASPPSIGPGMLLLLQSLNTQRPGSVGHFPPGDVASLQAAAIGQIKVLGALGRSPLHLLFPEGGVPPSGESLKVVESGLTGAAEEFQVWAGSKYADVMAMGVRLHNTFGTGQKLPEDVIITTLWRPAATRSELTDAQVTAIRGDDWSHMERLRRDGYSESDAASIIEEKDEETPDAFQAMDAAIARDARFGAVPVAAADTANEEGT